MSIRYFLGANTPAGFVSHYDDWLLGADKAFILKGTPGCGKSGFMRRVATAAEKLELPVEYIHCSGDASSLDGVFFPTAGTHIVDGTAPHVIEPKLPLAVERYIDLAAYVSPGPVRENADALAELFEAHRSAYARVYRCLGAAGAIHENLRSLVAGKDVLDKIARRARGVVRREITRGTGPVLQKRFLNAFTPDGETIFWETVHAQCDRVYTLQDAYGLAPFFLTPVLEAALEHAQEVTACYNPLDGTLEHLILPGLRLGFVSVGGQRDYPGEIWRHVRLNAIVPLERLRLMRYKLRMLRKTKAALLEETSELLGQTKLLHDAIEACYTPHTDFTRVTARAEELIDEIFA